MPTLNQIRLTNIKYNSDKRIVRDELLNIQGENTLSLLRNTGGKSVLTKFMLQPIMWEYDRFPRQGKTEYFDMRKFFETNREPCYVLEELKLEGNEGFLLIGVGIEKGTNEGKLKKVAFMHHYTSQENKYSLKNFPLFTRKGEDVILCGLDTIYEDLKEKISCFRSDNYEHRKNYRDKLLEYHINIKEFEKIHSRIINVEGGIAEVFADSGTVTTKDLLIDWIIPAIEGKLTVDEDDMGQVNRICNNIKDYVQTKIGSKEDQKKLDELRGFLRELDILYSHVEKKESLIRDFNNTKGNLISMYDELHRLHDQIEVDISEYTEMIADTKAEIKEYNYQKESYSIMSLYEQLKEQIQELTSLNQQKEELDSEKERFSCLLKLQEACGIYNELQELEVSINRKKNKLRPLEEKVAEYEKKTRNIKYTLKCICEKELSEINDKISHTKEQILSMDEEIKAFNHEIVQKTNSNKELIAWLGEHKLEAVLFEKERDDFNATYPEFTVQMKRKDEFELMQIQRTCIEQEEQLKTDEVTRANTLEEIVEIKKLLKSLDLEIMNNKEIRLNTESSLKEAEKDLERFNRIRNNVVSNILLYRFKEQDINRKEYVLSYLHNMKEEKEDEIHRLMIEVDEIDTQIGFFKNDKISINHQLEKQLKRNNIDIIFGFEYLKKSPLPIEQKEKLLKNNPLLPYSIIVSSKEYEKTKTILETSYTFNVVPILIKEQIEQYVISRENSLFEVASNIGLLGGYNEQLVTEDYMQQQITQLEEEAARLREKIAVKKEEVSRLEKVIHLVDGYEYTSESEPTLLNQIELLKNEINKQSALIVSLEERKTHSEAELTEKEAIVEELRLKIQTSVARLNALKKLVGKLDTYLETKEAIVIKEDLLKKQEETISRERELLREKDIERQNLSNKLSEATKQLNTFKEEDAKYFAYDEIGELVLDTKGILLAKKLLLEMLNECQNTNEYRNVSEIIKEIEEEESKYAFKLEDFNELNVEIENVRNISYDKSLVTEYKKQIDAIIELKYERSNAIGNLVGEIKRLNADIDKNKEKCITLYDKEYNSAAVKEDYEGLIKIKELEVAEIESELSISRSILENIERRLPKLEKFKDMEMPEGVVLEEVTADNMELLQDKYETLYLELRGKIDTAKNEITRVLNNCEAEYVKRLENTTVKEFLQRATKLTSELVLAGKKQIESLIYVLQVGEENLEKQFKAILGTTLDYTVKIHQELGKVDRNSYLESMGKKLFELAHIAKEGSPDLLSAYLEEIINTVVDGVKPEAYIEKAITTYNLLNHYISLDSVQANATKINAFDTKKVKFEDTHKNGECSGAQRSIIGFAILKCIMYYTNEGVIEDNRNTTSFMFLDNPFGVMSDNEVITPFFNIAEQFNTTLYSWTALYQPAVLKIHKNIYCFNIKPVGKKEYIEVVGGNDENGKELINTSYLQQFQEQLDINSFL